MEKILFVVPARGGSKGVPGKNLYSLAGQSLVYRAVRCALAARLGPVYISTDYPEIALEGQRAGAFFSGLRPAILADDRASTADVVRHLLETSGEQPEIIVIVQPTSPLRLAEDLSGAVKLLEGRPDADGVAAITSFQEPHPIKVSILNDEGFVMKYVKTGDYEHSRQYLSPVFRFTGGVYAVRHAVFARDGQLIPNRLLPWEMPPERAFNIDHPWDLVLLNALMERREVTVVDY